MTKGNGWCYGLVKEESGKIRVWEIYKSDDTVWGSRAVLSWMLMSPIMVIKDLIGQYKNMKALWNGKELSKGNKKMAKIWNKSINKILKKRTKLTS